MPIDASIPLQAKMPAFESPANQLAMMGNAMKIGEMQRGVEEQNKLNEYLRSGADLGSAEGKRGLLNYGKTGITYGKAVSEMEKAGLETKKLGFEIDERKMSIIRERSKDMLQNLSPENFTAHTQENVRDGLITAEQGQRAIQNYIATPPNQRAALINQNLATAQKVFEMNTISAAQKADLGIKQGHLNVAQQTLANANDPRIQEKLAAAKSSGTTKGKAIATAQINLPNAIATGEELIRKIDEMVGQETKIDKATNKVTQAGTKPHEGFKAAVGMGGWKALGVPGVQQYIPASAAADFKSRYDEIMGGAFLEAFETLKGGGSITETEGKKATAAKTRMNLAQSEQEFMSAAREYQGIVRKGLERAKSKAASGGSTGAGEIDFNNLK